MTKRDFSGRYAPNWKETRKKALRLTYGLCVLCRQKAAEVHHCRYSEPLPNGKFRKLYGCERPLVDVFPLCKNHHEEAHNKLNWVWVKADPCWLNHNTESFRRRLLKVSQEFARESMAISPELMFAEKPSDLVNGYTKKHPPRTSEPLLLRYVRLLLQNLEIVLIVCVCFIAVIALL